MPSSDEIEARLSELFDSGYPVLVSSGRAALTLALIASSAQRNMQVGVFPFASHCVLDAVSRVATPQTGHMASEAPLRIVFHQWGFVLESVVRKNTIEDCADTLCIPGTQLFPAGGCFEVWSLPKILGTTTGGVLWCRDAKAAEEIKVLRDARGRSLQQLLLRWGGRINKQLYLYWQGAEASLGAVSRAQTGEIYRAVRGWSAIVADRMRKLEVAWPYAAAWLPRPTHRLPPVVPVDWSNNERDFESLPIIAEPRMLERIHDATRVMHRVLPVPIHQEVSTAWLEMALHKIGARGR